MKYRISHETDPNPENIQTLYDGLKQHMLVKRNLKPISFFHYYIKDENDQIAGGCNGCILYGSLVVDTLWITESLRGQGYGTKLMQLAETTAIEHACRFMTVNMMDWEALDFYKKLGFYIEFQRSGFDQDSTFYFLRKELGS